MIELLPPGTVIGHMEAPYRWIFSHTTRFIGLVLIDIHEGRGFLLINRGKPLKCYFSHGSRILWGHTAYEYFRNQPVIPFELRRYTNDDLSNAIQIINREETCSLAKDLQEVLPSGADLGLPTGQAAAGEEGKGAISSTGASPMETAGRAIEETETTRPGNSDQVLDAGRHGIVSPGAMHPPHRESLKGFAGDAAMARAGELLLGRLISIPGVIAVSIFSRRMNILSLGTMNLDDLVDVAEDLLSRIGEIISLLKTGPLVQVTLQVPAGNLIIAPFLDEYLCILTSQEINLGQIRKILRDLPGKDYTEEESPRP